MVEFPFQPLCWVLTALAWTGCQGTEVLMTTHSWQNDDEEQRWVHFAYGDCWLQDASDVAQIRCPRVGAFYLTQELNSASISVSNDIGIFCHQSGIFPISKLQSPPAPLNVSITIHAFIIIDLYNSHHGLHLKKKHSG
jgi:hypothetical protein